MRRRRNRRRRRPHRARPCSDARRRACAAWLIGLSSENSSAALSPSPSAAKAMTDQIGGMGVLAAVLADAGRIALDVAGIERRLVERRREQQRQAVIRGGPAALDGRHRACGARRDRPPRRSRPGLRDRVDPAFVVRASRAACRRRSSRADTSRRPSRRARATLAARRRARASARRAPSSPRASASGAKAVSVACRNQPSQTLSPLPLADPVHAVVPVAGADQRQAVRADARGLVERRARSARRAWPSRRTIVGLEESCRARRRAAAGPRGRARARRGPRRRRSSRRSGRRRRQPDPSSEMRVRTPWPECGSHQCWTSPSTNCRAAARSRCSRVSAGLRQRPAPCRPATDRGSRTRRSPDRTPSAPRCGRPASDRAASGSA